MTADQLNANDFIPFIGKTFHVPEHPQQLVLVAVDTRRPPGWERMPRPPFSLLLRGPHGHVVPEGLYRVTADKTRDFDLYLVPVQTPSREYQDYQAVFN